MKQSTLAALTAALIANATLLSALATELGADAGAAPETDDTPAAEPAAKAGRGRGRGAAAPKDEPAPGKTLDELKALIKPLIDDARGDEVKKIIAKYGASLKELPADTHADFEKDILAISY